jgi:asparagine synthetase B (glutamine-hydrolysing)
MCGIHLAISRRVPASLLSSDLDQKLRNRGPDHYGQFTARLDVSPVAYLTFTSTVLGLRGGRVQEQPFVNPESGSVLCWNGEAWKIRGQTVNGNDGAALFALLTTASASTDEAAVVDVLRSVEGPFAFVYFDQAAGKVYYGRDRLGRRSLLVRDDEVSGSWVVSSIPEACEASWREVEADGVYVLDMISDETSIPFRHEWLVYDKEEYVSAQCRCEACSSILLVPGFEHWQVQYVHTGGDNDTSAFSSRCHGAW